jgi:hypothetical protein
MSKETVVRLVDDLDGSEASVSYGFTWDGIDYEIDLSKKNARDLDNLIKPYLVAANRVKVGPVKRVARTPKPAGVRIDMTAVREWATQNGHKVADRGRVASAVVEAFNAARNSAAETLSDVAEKVEAAASEVNAPAVKKAPSRKTAAKRVPAKKVVAVKVTPAKRGRPAKKVAAATVPTSASA